MPQVDIDYYRSNFGFPVQCFYENLGFDFKARPYEAIAAEYITEYNRRRFECSLQDSAVEILSALSAKGFTHSILSAYQQQMLDEAVSFYQIRDMFVNCVGMTDFYAHSKIEMGLSLMSQLNLPPSAILMIGDTAHDLEVANQLGIDCILLDHGHQHASRFPHAPIVLNSISQIPTLSPLEN